MALKIAAAFKILALADFVKPIETAALAASGPPAIILVIKSTMSLNDIASEEVAAGRFKIWVLMLPGDFTTT